VHQDRCNGTKQQARLYGHGVKYEDNDRREGVEAGLKH
jgi:hypothetical protein